jgi:RNA polymerase primary sigma factor
MSDNAFRDYLIQIGQYPLLNAQQELALGERIANGDAAARERLINCNLRLVVHIAKNYKNVHLPIEDLVMEGNLGLVTAVDKYDYKLGYRFSTCATPWIKQSILKAITDKGKTIRLPAHVYAQLNKMRDALDILAMNGNLDPTAADIAKEMGIDEERVYELRQWKKDALSLDTPIGDEEKNCLGDLVEDTRTETPVEYTERQLTHDRIQAVLAGFPERTQQIMKLRYGLADANDPAEYNHEHTLEEIGVLVGITRERVRQIEKQALAEMKLIWDRVN